MDAQPDFERLAECLAAASQEFRKLPNVPVINQGLTALNTMQTRIDVQFQDLGVSMMFYIASFKYIDTDSFKTRIDGWSN